MAITRPPVPEHHPTPPNPHRGEVHPSALVRRTQTAAIRSAHPGSPPTAATWAPWAPLQKEADARLKTELDVALAELNARAADAAQILDRATTLADQRAEALQAQAYALFKRYNDMADKSWADIMGPALAAYDDRISQARSRYDQLLNHAESTHSAMVSDAARASNLGSGITGVA